MEYAVNNTLTAEKVSVFIDNERDPARKTQLLNLYTTVSLDKELTEEDIHILNELNFFSINFN